MVILTNIEFNFKFIILINKKPIKLYQYLKMCHIFFDHKSSWRVHFFCAAANRFKKNI